MPPNTKKLYGKTHMKLANYWINHMSLNLDKYRHHLDDYDMSETQKTEFIKAIALIAESLADRAFGLGSIHQIKLPKQPQNCTQSAQMVQSINVDGLVDKTANDNNKPNKIKKQAI